MDKESNQPSKKIVTWTKLLDTGTQWLLVDLCVDRHAFRQLDIAQGGKNKGNDVRACEMGNTDCASKRNFGVIRI